LSVYFDNIKNILEPSCGSCEYIVEINKRYPDKEIIGIEKNETIYNQVKKLTNNKISIINDNFLLYDNKDIYYDLIIGNPPYFVMKKKDVDKTYFDFFDGRPNIFILFIIKSLSLLSPGGILSFILPKSFINCLYYEKTRQYIYDNFKIIDIIECVDKSLETQQTTVMFIVQKPCMLLRLNMSEENKDFVLVNDEFVLFGSPNNIIKLNKLYKNASTINKLKCKATIGTVLWNESKDLLTSDNTKTRLIYSTDVENNQLVIKKYKNPYKKNYICKKGLNTPIIIINRGYGTGVYKFEYCLIDGSFDYLVENHLICITSNNDKHSNMKLYQRIIKSFGDIRTKEFIKLYFGNNAINATELMYVLPIY
jgi:adenine-specific DNA-methyltransferase